jgi:gliding motility-associated-like protein
MKKLSLSLWAMMCLLLTHAQQITFRTSYDIAALDIPGNLIQAPDRNYVLAGTNTSFIPLYGNVTKIDTIGNVIWSKGYSGGSIATDIWDIKNVSTGGFITAGSSGSGLMLMKLDANGNVSWSNRYRVASGTDEYASRLIETSDGGFVAAGYIYGADPDGAGALARQDSANFFCLKVNSAGTLQWAKVFFYSTAYINDHVLNDVAEVSDGYIFGGYASEVATDDGSDAVLLKTDINGNLQWMKKWGSGSNSEEVTSIVALSGTEVMVNGDDNSKAFYLKLSSAGTVNSGNQYTFPGLLSVGIPYNGFVTNDGQYGMVGSYISPLAFTFASFVLKVNSSTGAVIFSRGYNSGLSSILPEGRQVADSGYIMAMTAQQFTGFNYHLVKTDKNGFMNNTNCDTTIITSPSRSNFAPSLSNVTSVNISGASTNSVSVVVANLNPTQVIECIQVPCNNPPTPTASASQNPICAGSSTTISGSGSGSVTYKVYDAASGGNFLGNAPLSVSPSASTTYYVGAESSSQPGCSSLARGSVLVTVNNPPANVGAITGQTSTCVGSQNYSIGAVSGASSYTWSVSGGGTITSGQGTTSIAVNWTTAGGPYTVSVTASNGCGNKSNSVAVTVNPSVSGVTATASPNPVCAGATLTLTGGGNAVTGWSWTGPATFSAATQNTSRANIVAAHAGTYTLNATGTCGSGSASVVVTVNDVPQAVTATANPNPACVGNTVLLNGSATNASSWSWSGPNSFGASSQNTSVANAQTVATGTYTLTATNACGNATATVNVTINSLPLNVNATATPTAVCPGASLNLSGNATGASTYSWSGPSTYSSSQLNNTINNFQAANVGTYTLTATNTCGSASASVNVNLSAGPTNVNAGAALTNLCINTSLNLTGSAVGATTFAWSGPNGFSTAQQNPTRPNITLADSGLYTLVATNICGTATASVNVDVDAPIQNLVTTAAPNDTICAGGNINFSASATQANTWSWSGPNSYSSTLQNPVIASATAANSGTYTVTAVNACGNSSASLSVLVNNPIQNLSASATGGNNVCSSSSINLSASGSNINGYSWSGPDGFSSTLQNPTIINATVASGGIYTVTAINACGNQTTTVTVQVDTLIQNLNTTASPNDTICAGVNITLAATGQNVNTWSWTGPSAFSSTLQTTTINNAQAANSGNYIVTATNACGSVNDTLSVLVNTVPLTPGTITGTGTTCGNDTATYFISAISNATDYTWSISGGTILSGQGTTSITVNWGSSSGTFTVSVTAANICGGSTASSLTVTVQAPEPVMNASILGDTAVCPSIESYSIPNIPNATSYVWTVNGGTILNGQGTTGINVEWPSAGLQTVSVVAQNSCGTSSAASVTVNVHPAPTAPTVTMQNDTICEGTSTVITATNSTGGNVSYNFYDASTGGNLLGVSPLTVSPTTNTIYYLEVINQFGCTNSNGRVPVTVYVIQAPTILGIDADSDTICAGESGVLTANVSPAGTTVTWWDNAIGGTQIATGNTLNTGALTQSTTYFAQATSSGGCQNLQGRIAAAVTVTQLPVVTLTSDKDNNTIFPNEVINFTALPDSLSNYEFFWNETSVQSSNLNTWASSKLNDLDSIWVIATNNGCASERSVGIVRVVDFPNAFTPNEDGKNDVFLKGYDLIIVNRWGQELYQGRDGWDGKYNGDKVSPGTYYYVVTLDNITDRKSAIKGTVLLIED